MKLMKKIMTFALAAIFAALAMVPATLAYNYHTTYPTASYWAGETRMGAYSSTWGYGQGMYNYVSPPYAQYRYGAGYHWGSNVRWTTYGGDTGVVRNYYRPYLGYPYAGFGNPVWENYRHTYYNSYYGG